MDIFPLEWSGCGRGDYRESPLELLQNGTPISTDFRYTGCEALKTPLPSVLPASRGQTVLAVYLEDKAAKLRLTLLYGVLPTVFTRRAILENFSDTPVSIQKFMSTCTDIPGDWTMHTFSGGWIAEMHHTKTPVAPAWRARPARHPAAQIPASCLPHRTQQRQAARSADSICSIPAVII